MDILLAAIPFAPVARTADLLADRVLAQDVGEAVIRLRAARQARGTQSLGLAVAAARTVLPIEAQAGFCQQGIELFIRQPHTTSKHVVAPLIVARCRSDQASAPVAVRIGRDDEAVSADTRNDGVLTFAVVNALVTHAASDELKLCHRNLVDQGRGIRFGLEPLLVLGHLGGVALLASLSKWRVQFKQALTDRQHDIVEFCWILLAGWCRSRWDCDIPTIPNSHVGTIRELDTERQGSPAGISPPI